MSFAKALKQTLDAARGNEFKDNWDYRRFGPHQEPSFPKRITDAVKVALREARFCCTRRAKQCEWLYNRLIDEQSRQIMLKVLAYRIMGYRKVKLPVNSPSYWSKLAELEARASDAESFVTGFRDWRLWQMNLAPEGFPFELFVSPEVVISQFVLEQYRCQLPDRPIEVEPGDTVIDAGGCYGDTALYCAHKAGSSGSVHSFEFLPSNVVVFERNMALNPTLADTIHLIKQPLWSSSGQKLFIEGTGPAAHITGKTRQTSATEVRTLSIDTYVQKRPLSRIDFIKMDIEGAELPALIGARQCLVRYRPKLAISIYHSLADFWRIPQWIDSLELGYRFALRHFTIHREETVLFAAIEEQ